MISRDYDAGKEQFTATVIQKFVFNNSSMYFIIGIFYFETI